MDFHAETEKRKQQHLGQTGELSYRHFMATRTIAENRRLLEELEISIAEHEAAIRECETAQRNFETYRVIEAGKSKAADGEGAEGELHEEGNEAPTPDPE